MNMPPFLLAAALLFWGWQAGALAVAAVFALAVEAPRHTRVRFDLGPGDYSRIADFCTVLFVALIVFLAATRGVTRGVLTAFEWLPAVLLPVVVAQRLGRADRVNLSALFLYLRRLRQRDASVEDPLVDTSWVFLGVTLIAAGTANSRGVGYFAGVVLIAGWALYAMRPRHHARPAWLALFAAAALSGYYGQMGLAQLQTMLETLVPDWTLGTAPDDPYRSSTRIGQLGEIKASDAIVARVHAPEADPARPRLLHRASYNRYSGTSWLARTGPMRQLTPEPDGATWPLAGAPAGGNGASSRVKLSVRLNQGKSLLALPQGTLKLAGLPATRLKRNALGAVQAEIEGDWASYAAETGSADSDAPPDADDMLVPDAERPALRRVADELRLRGLPPQQVVQRVERFFSGFGYSTYRGAAAQGPSPIADFLTRSRSGHCEYFAAATALLLREAGIPARYATGYSVQEYSRLEQAYLVRNRHSHAWVRARVDGRWIDLDTTPATWFAEEEKRAPAWQGLADLLGWARFRLSQRSQTPAQDSWWLWAGAALAVWLGWRLAGKRRLSRDEAPGPPATAPVDFPGCDSEFYRVMEALSARVGVRATGEPVDAWVARAGRVLDARTAQRLDRLAKLHQRYRFDPAGLTAADRAQLEGESSAMVASPDAARTGA